MALFLRPKSLGRPIRAEKRASLHLGHMKRAMKTSRTARNRQGIGHFEPMITCHFTF